MTDLEIRYVYSRQEAAVFYDDYRRISSWPIRHAAGIRCLLLWLGLCIWMYGNPGNGQMMVILGLGTLLALAAFGGPWEAKRQFCRAAKDIDFTYRFDSEGLVVMTDEPLRRQTWDQVHSLFETRHGFIGIMDRWQMWLPYHSFENAEKILEFRLLALSRSVRFHSPVTPDPARVIPLVIREKWNGGV